MITLIHFFECFHQPYEVDYHYPLSSHEENKASASLVIYLRPRKYLVIQDPGVSKFWISVL